MYKYCSRMNGYSVVSSVHLTESPQLYSLASVNCLPRRLSIVLRTRTIKFKWDPFSMGIISYVSWGIRLHEEDRSTRSDWSGRINLNTLYRKGDHITWGDRLFRVTGTDSPKSELWEESTLLFPSQNFGEDSLSLSLLIYVTDCKGDQTKW